MATPQKAVCGELWIWDPLSDCAVWRRWLALSSAFLCKRKLMESSNETALHMLSLMCVPVFGSTACVSVGVRVCVCVHAQESFTLESSAPCRAACHSWHPPDCTQLSKWICLADHVDSSVCFGFQLMESVPLMTIHFCPEFQQQRTVQYRVFWLWNFDKWQRNHTRTTGTKSFFASCPLPTSPPVYFHGGTTCACEWCAVMWGLCQGIFVFICVRVCMLFSVCSLSLWVAVWCL